MNELGKKIEAQQVVRYVVGKQEYKTLEEAQAAVRKDHVHKIFDYSDSSVERDKAWVITEAIMKNWFRIKTIMEHDFFGEPKINLPVAEERKIDV